MSVSARRTAGCSRIMSATANSAAPMAAAASATRRRRPGAARRRPYASRLGPLISSPGPWTRHPDPIRPVPDPAARTRARPGSARPPALPARRRSATRRRHARRAVQGRPRPRSERTTCSRCQLGLRPFGDVAASACAACRISARIAAPWTWRPHGCGRPRHGRWRAGCGTAPGPLRRPGPLRPAHAASMASLRSA